jgi:hypothetical protein
MKSAKRLTRKSAKSKPKPTRKTARKKSALGAPGPTVPGVPLIGQVGLFAFGFSAAGWSSCDGRLMSVMQNQALFSLLGGDGRTSFGLPKLKPVGPQGPGYFIAVQGAYPMR